MAGCLHSQSPCAPFTVCNSLIQASCIGAANTLCFRRPRLLPFGVSCQHCTVRKPAERAQFELPTTILVAGQVGRRAWLPHALTGCLRSQSSNMQVDNSCRSATRLQLSKSCSASRKHSAHAASKASTSIKLLTRGGTPWQYTPCAWLRMRWQGACARGASTCRLLKAAAVPQNFNLSKSCSASRKHSAHAASKASTSAKLLTRGGTPWQYTSRAWLRIALTGCLRARSQHM